MQRSVSRTVMVIGVAAACALAGAPALLRAQPPGGAAPLTKGWGRLVASGTLAAADPAAGTVTLTVAGTGRLETYEGGTTWRQKFLSGTYPVHLLPATLLLDADAHPIAPASVHGGEGASVWAAVRPDGAILALTLQVTSFRVRAAAAPRTDAGPVAAAAGVVVQRSGPVLTLLTSSGANRSVVITAATAVRLRGQPATEAALVAYDVLRVEGPVNSDGSLAATRIDVEFAAAASAQVSGPVEQNAGGVGGLVVSGTMISTSAETYVVRNAARAAVAQVVTGAPVTVYGSAILAGATPVGLEARVVVVR